MKTHGEAPAKGALRTLTLPSGAILHLERIPYAAACRLKRALLGAFGAQPPSAEEMKLSLDQLKANPSAGGAILSRLVGVLASEGVDAAVLACAASALYQPKGSGDFLKVDEALFDHPEYGDVAREDQVRIWFVIGEAVMRPFLAPIVSAYLAFQAKAGNSPAGKPESPKNA